MQSVDLTQLNQLDEDLNNLLNEIPEKRRELHERLADVIKSEVDTQIVKSGLNDSEGKIREWQKPVVGSGGGYAAVHAVKGTTGANSPGAITNYLENGHKIRRPTGKNKYYRPRIRKAYVDGFHFYNSASSSVESKAIAEAEEYVKEIAQRLEG